MAKGMHRLSARTVATAKAGRHSDGGGLYLVVTPTGARQWAFIIWRDRKPQEVGLGSVAQGVSLAMARDRAAECRRLVAEGHPPKNWKQPAGTAPTFGEFADQVISSLESGWRNDKHRAQWRSTIAIYCKPIHAKPLNEVTTELVLGILQPIWTAKNETASRLRGRIEKVLDAAKAKGYRDGENPARWRGHLDHLLPKRQKLQRGHHAALDWKELPPFLTRLREREAVAALALEFTILTAARSGEALGARWDEIDHEAKVWNVPALRMKSGRDHRVPLAPRALAILDAMRQAQTASTYFPPSEATSH